MTEAPSSASSENVDQKAEDLPLPGGDFRLFIQKLGYQALIGMGVLENPLTKSRDANPDQAQMVINDLMMLRDRTQGNLKDDEQEHLERVIGDLQRHFVELSQKVS